MHDSETLHRKARLRELVGIFGSQSALMQRIKLMTGTEVNQGELSSLCRDEAKKSFGYKKAGKLAEQVGLPRTWFEMPLGSMLNRSEWTAEKPTHMVSESTTLTYESQALAAPAKQSNAILAALDTLESACHDLDIETRKEVASLIGIFVTSLRHTTKDDVLAAILGKAGVMPVQRKKL